MRYDILHVCLAWCYAWCYLNGSPAAAQPVPSDTVVAQSHRQEDQLFDTVHTTPVQLLRNIYDTHRVLIFGFTSHDKTTQYRMLDSLLRYVGHDPHLKRIALERPIESARILEATSTHAIGTVEFRPYFPNEQSLRASLAQDEWKYTFDTLMPKIRALNAQRPADNPVRVTTVDGVSFVTETFGTAAEGESRETETSHNFTRTLWNGLMPTDKVILLYHLAHVTKTFTVLNTGWQPVGSAPTDTLNFNSEPDPYELLPSDTVPFGTISRIPSDWLGTFLRDTPGGESQIGVVLLDECVAIGPRVRPVLKFTERQAARYPHQSFGVFLAPFRGVVSDSGLSAFATPVIRNHGVGLHSSESLTGMYDGVIWLPPASSDNPHSDSVADVCR